MENFRVHRGKNEKGEDEKAVEEERTPVLGCPIVFTFGVVACRRCPAL